MIVSFMWSKEQEIHMKVAIVDPVPPALSAAIAQRLPDGIAFAAAADFSDEELARVAGDADVLMLSRRRLDAAALALTPKVRFIQCVGAGYDALDVHAVVTAGIPVAYNPGVNAASVAEHTVMLILTLLRRFVEGERQTRAGHFRPFELIPRGLNDIADMTVGLLGMGAIGQATAQRLAGFGPTVLYHARTRLDDRAERLLGVTYTAFAELLAASNVVSIHVALTPATRHLLGDKELAMMPPGSFLVNTARGGIVDDGALRRAIERGHLAGAALDVLTDEAAAVNPFADLSQVIVTPHLGGVTIGAFRRMIDLSIENIFRFSHGEAVQNLIPEFASSGDDAEADSARDGGVMDCVT